MQRALQSSVVTVSALVLLFARTVRAEDSAAEALFRQGREAIVNGEIASGCALLAESDRLEPSPGAKLSLGLCEEQLGHHARAWVLLQKVIQALTSEDPRFAIARRHAEEITPKLAFVNVVVTGQQAIGMRVTSDVRELTTADLGVPLPFDPGDHFFQISAPGWEPGRVSIALRAGAHERVELSLKAAPPQSAAPKPPLVLAPRRAPATERSPMRSAGLALEGAAAALLVTSVTSGALAIDAKNDMNHGCDEKGLCSDAALRAAERGSTLATVSTLTFLGAVASGGLGALFLVLGRTPPASRASPSANIPELRIRF